MPTPWLVPPKAARFRRCVRPWQTSPQDLTELLEHAIANEPPLLLREGGMIKDGYDAELDALRDLRSGGKAFIAQIEETERERTGIKTLKVGFNNVFGYYIEVSKANGSIDVPAEYHRKQTTANGERYITPALERVRSAGARRGRKDRRPRVSIVLQVRDDSRR